MTTKQIVNTYKNGVLVSTKELELKSPVNPQTGKAQKEPQFANGLIAIEAAQHAFLKAQVSLDETANELRKLRKELIQARRAVAARTKERDSLRKAYLKRTAQVERLEILNEDLEARLFSAAEDLRHLEEVAARQATSVKVTTGTTATNNRPLVEHKKTKAAETKKDTAKASETKEQEPSKPRSIAASPIKR